MSIKAGVALYVFCSVVLLRGALYADTVDRKIILTESAVWRTYVVWGPALTVDKAGQLKTVRSTQNLQLSTPPPAEWINPDYDDSEWGFWREVHAPAQSMDGTTELLYDPWQYGIHQSLILRRRCLRGKFVVDDPSKVKWLKLKIIYRGGTGVFINGQQIALGHISSDAIRDPAGLAELYPEEIYYNPDGKLWDLKSGNIKTFVIKDARELENFNRRLRRLTVEIPVTLLRKGINVLAIDIRRAPYPSEVNGDWWSTCGVASIEMSGEGAVQSALNRPQGIQIWSSSILSAPGPIGYAGIGRIGNGREVLLTKFPFSWLGEIENKRLPVRLITARNSVASAQILVSSSETIKNLKVVTGDMNGLNHGGKISALNCQIRYMNASEDVFASMSDPAFSRQGALLEVPPQVVEVLPEKPLTKYPPTSSRDFRVAWNDGVAMVGVWIMIRIPRDIPPDEYTGKLVISADGIKPVEVPVKLKVYGYVLPDSRNFTPHIALVHSPDTLSLKYKVPLWSEKHFQLMEKTIKFMGELGGSVVFIPLICNSWLGNSQTMVYWKKEGEKYTCDFRVLDRYLDLIWKYMSPRAACLYVFDQRQSEPCVSMVDGNTINTLHVPRYESSPDAIAFWQPAIEGIKMRLKQHGLDKNITLGLTVEGGPEIEKMQPVVSLFKTILPEGKWTDLGHFGARKGNICGVPYGYVMSVWGNETPTKSKAWGALDLPFVLVKHYRADPVIDLRPIAPRGSLYWATEVAMGYTFWGRGGPGKQTQGVGPLGMDFWNFTPEERKSRWEGSLEGGITNLRMSDFSTSAFLAPGPDGPVPTPRFEVFRQGLQLCEARTLIERALEKGVLDANLTKKCREMINRRMNVLTVIAMAEASAQREGWNWFESGVDIKLAEELLECATEVSKVWKNE
jgi:hypothetical protein